ncbi:MAG: tRNA uracil 4-sulfurtransferase ThiI [Actinomycetota bacterium]
MQAEPRTNAGLAHGVVVHYHEIGLKGRNRGSFERQLVMNLERALGDAPNVKVESLSGRLLVRTPDVASPELVAGLAETFGVAFLASCLVIEADIDAMTTAALTLIGQREFATFAIAARRATKDFHLTSNEINVQLGAAVQAATGAGVNLSRPDVTVAVDVIGRRAIVYAHRVTGPGGLPVGVSGKVVSLLSGGIDSPVATLRLLKRGAKAVLCHFHSAPFTDLSSARKATELARIIAKRQGATTLYKISIGNAQQQIVVAAPPELRVVLYRRLMMRIAEVVAKRESAKALVTGDSLGQVASQTLDNIVCVDDVATLPVFRPLIGVDKLEIVNEAKMYRTYETSILPFEDCCSLFVPKSPATHASIDACRAAESELDIDAMVNESFAAAEVERVS